jgi:hypothetical protein
VPATAWFAPTVLAAAALILLAPRAPASGQDAPLRLEGLGGARYALAFEGLEDASAAGLAFVESVLEREDVLLGEPVTLRLRFGFEREFLERNLVQLFQRELDVPAQLSAPWLTALDGALALAHVEPVAGARVALGEEIVLAVPRGEQRRAARDYRVFELTRTFVPARTGEFALEEPRLRFAHATHFGDDFVQGRVPLDRRDAYVRGPGARLTVRALPEQGRPPEFTGAIGRFTLRATAEPRELASGASLALTLVIEREGPLGSLAEVREPRLDDLPGFHLRGQLAEREERRLSVRYDLVPDGPAVRAIPPVRFAYFDTTPPAGYRVLASEPIPITVRGSRVEPEAPAQAEEVSAGGTKTLRLALAGLAALVLLGVLLARARRRS